MGVSEVIIVVGGAEISIARMAGRWVPGGEVFWWRAGSPPPQQLGGLGST